MSALADLADWGRLIDRLCVADFLLFGARKFLDQSIVAVLARIPNSGSQL